MAQVAAGRELVTVQAGSVKCTSCVLFIWLKRVPKVDDKGSGSSTSDEQSVRSSIQCILFEYLACRSASRCATLATERSTLTNQYMGHQIVGKIDRRQAESPLFSRVKHSCERLGMSLSIPRIRQR